MIYPWQQTHWQQLEQDIASDRLAHALLLIGQAGMGKLAFAKELAKTILTQHSPESEALLTAGTHPDYLLVQPLEDKKIISIDQIRELQKELQQTAHVSDHRVVIIEPAERMNIASSNALLKTLEEPAENVIIILVSSQPQRLPATIRSRCRTLSFCQAHDTETIKWLQRQLLPGQDAELLLNLAHGAPLAALNMVDADIQTQRKVVFKNFSSLLRGEVDPVEIANEWQKYDVWQILSWLQTWLLDISRVQANIKSTVNNEKYQTAITSLAECLSKKAVFEWLDNIGALKKQLAQVTQTNLQLAIEELLIRMQYGRSHHG